MSNIVEIQDLFVSYDGKNVIESLSFSVEKEDFLVIFGENGSGKSTLVKALLGLKNPSKGKISFMDCLKQRDIGYLPQLQNFQEDFPASVWEVVLSGCLNKMGLRPFYGKKEKETAEKNMNLLGIYNLRNECFRSLSGGQRQKVLLARALCAAKTLLILDEPVSGLDSASTAEFYTSLNKINKSGTAVIMISHDINASLHNAKHVLYLHESGKHFFGTAEEYEKD